MAILDWLHDRFEFCFQTVKEEYQRSGWYKAMSISAPFYIVIGLFITFANPIPSWSWTTRVIILLSSVIVSLFVVVEAVYRSVKRSENARPVIEVLVPSAFVRPVPNNRSICQVFVRVELRNATPHRPKFTKYLLDFKVKGKTAARLTKFLDLTEFQVCNTVESYDDDHHETWISYADCEGMEDLRTIIQTDGPPEDGFPAIGWLGFIVRKSVLPYKQYEEPTGRSTAVFDDEGVPEEIEEMETRYVPQFKEIEEVKLIVVDGYQQSWSGIAGSINPSDEAVIPR